MDRRKTRIPLMVIAGGILLILAGLAYAFLNQPASPVTTAAPASVDQIPRVSLKDSKAALDAGTAVFVDVRDSASYDSSHIPGALPIPLNELSGKLNELNPSSWIITYCT